VTKEVGRLSPDERKVLRLLLNVFFLDFINSPAKERVPWGTMDRRCGLRLGHSQKPPPGRWGHPYAGQRQGG